MLSRHISILNPHPFARMPTVLTLLRIKNLALVEELEWSMEPGFIAVTGETGAGKSIIIGALQLLLGERADKSLIRTGTDICTVEAVFSGDESAKTKRATCRSRNRAMRERSHPEAVSLLERNESAIHQRLTNDVIHLETSWRRTCRSSWTARSPVVAFARDAIALTRFVRTRRHTVPGISKVLPAITDAARRACCAQHRGDRPRTGTGSASASESPRLSRRNSSRAKKKRLRTTTNWPLAANG